MCFWWYQELGSIQYFGQIVYWQQSFEEDITVTVALKLKYQKPEERNENIDNIIYTFLFLNLTTCQFNVGVLKLTTQNEFHWTYIYVLHTIFFFCIASHARVCKTETIGTYYAAITFFNDLINLKFLSLSEWMSNGRWKKYIYIDRYLYIYHSTESRITHTSVF